MNTRRLTAWTALVAVAMTMTVLAQNGDAPAADEAQAQPEPPEHLATPTQRASYTIGLNIGSNLRAQGLKLDPAAIALGVADGLADEDPQLTEAQMEAALDALQAALEAQRAAEGEAAEARGQAFLDQNRQKEGVRELESGIQYEVIEEGQGQSPTAADTVRVHYRGTLIDGTEFDSSYERGQPATFGVSQVIPGWTEVLQQMKPGAKWRVVIPAPLAYGQRGAGGRIGPNETLIFDIELLEVVDAPAGDPHAGHDH